MKKQMIFTYSTEAEHQQLIAVLESQGFHDALAGKDCSGGPKAICADFKEKEFFPTNATCCAGWAQAGKPFIPASQAEEAIEANLD